MTDQTPDLMTETDAALIEAYRNGANISFTKATILRVLARVLATYAALADKTARYDEIHREWEWACERERTANYLLADKTKECAEVRTATLREVRERVEKMPRRTAGGGAVQWTLGYYEDTRGRMDVLAAIDAARGPRTGGDNE